MLVSCELGYSGRWAPQIDFRDLLGESHRGVNATVTRGTAVYTLTLPADRAWHRDRDFTAMVSIEDIVESGDPPNTGNREADNQPTFPGNEESTIDIPDFQVWCKHEVYTGSLYDVIVMRRCCIRLKLQFAFHSTYAEF